MLLGALQLISLRLLPLVCPEGSPPGENISRWVLGSIDEQADERGDPGGFLPMGLRSFIASSV